MKGEQVERLRQWIDAAPDVDDLLRRLTEMEEAVAAAVEFAEYVEGAAKGAMVERAKHFLSVPFAKEVSALLQLARDYETLRQRVVAMHTGDFVDGCGMTNAEIAALGQTVALVPVPTTEGNTNGS